MNLLSEIFSNPSDIAKFITTVIAAIVAVFVVLLTHSLSVNRGRVELKLKKYEEAYEALEKYKRKGFSVISEKVGAHEIEGYAESFHKMEMLSLLYIPTIKNLIHEMDVLCLSITTNNAENDLRKEHLDKFMRLGQEAEIEIVKLVNQKVR